MKTNLLIIIGIALLILAGLIVFSILFQYDQNFSTPFVIMIDDLTSSYRESARHSNYDASNVLDCNDVNNPYNEYECFRDAFSSCHAAIVNPEVYTIEGDPIYASLKINSDCLVEGTLDTSTDRFATPEIINTKCDGIGRNQHVWSVEHCDAENLPEMQFNFMMQMHPKISECKENGDVWVDESMECIKQEPNPEDYPFGPTGSMINQDNCNRFALSQWQPTVEGKDRVSQFLDMCIQREFVSSEDVEMAKIADQYTTGSIDSAYADAEGDLKKTIQILQERHAKNPNYNVTITPQTGKTGVYKLDYGDKVFEMHYSIKEASIMEMTFSNYTNSLLIKIEPVNQGELEIAIPRELLDAKFDYCPPRQANPPDDKFFVLLDSEEILYDEILTDSQSRTLKIQLANDSKKIEIIATCLI